ncbi:hypothetical protein A3A76_02550 [Candidatus Woesebacteria bacterium RIFCSPLOWO2_01_FULL_39_23]|uniref:Prepilin leader peptidase/N-methyltransferase n=1 Tax=Candidatus Woesebacteria bacterium RIFCSPHIGHO2_01_FULL_40_22 TaxID=1802499 RepID=A0A1F7YJ34_9BACT|nr:MAG: hypothetical protein A2628_00955 [Candidatus Woesebacteria bacterium RIFCSPHIGHO2_01_FULL_40_22]OGM62528.1 MAG: hypothetical protein A3A76_02550 [Candidatus Woesebacteria bacterium RIFCSPLOWO2_01_FULL_39_23]
MLIIILYLLVSVLGLVAGSFISALSYRLPLGIKITKGRSFCDNCGTKIAWYDNIPVFSYFLLDGKCRCCKKEISLRYSLIEFSTLLVFLSIAYFYVSCVSTLGSAVCQWRNLLGSGALPYLLMLAAGFVTLAVIDLEHQMIPDKITLSLFAITSLILIFLNPDYAYQSFLAGFLAALFLLLIHLATKGKGMGLGDVKLALLGGVILGWRSTVPWLMLSFIIGAVVGLILILFGKAKFGKHIPFGPFLVVSFFLALVFGDRMFSSILRL